MSQLVYSSIEQPLQKNEQLHWLDEDTGAVVLAVQDIPQLNRYAFLMNRAATEAEALIALISKYVALQPRQIAAWRKEGSRVAQRLRRKTLEGVGWCILEEGRLDLGVRPAVDWPHGDYARTSVVLWSGEQIDLVDPAWALLAAGQFAPGRSLTHHLINGGWTLTYLRRDNLGRTGFIVLTPLVFSREEIVEHGLGDRVFEGSEAQMLWRQGTSITL